MNISVKIVPKDSTMNDLQNKAKRKSMIENGLSRKGKDRKWLSEQTGISLFNLNAYIDGMTNLDERQTKKIVNSIGIDSFMQEAAKESPLKAKPQIRPVTVNEDQEDKASKGEPEHKSQVFSVNGPAQRYKNVGEMIKYYAMKKHISPSDMSRRLNCRQSDFEEWENDVSLPNQQTFLEILKILQIKEMQYGDLEKAPLEEQKKVEEEGAKLRSLRASKNISINDLAKEINGTRFEIQCYENGYVKPDSETYNEMIRVLNEKPHPKASQRRRPSVQLTRSPKTAQERRMAAAFGKRLRNERMKRNMNTADVYQKTSFISKEGWSYKMVENGKLLPTKHLIDELAAALECNESVLIRGIAGFEDFLNKKQRPENPTVKEKEGSLSARSETVPDNAKTTDLPDNGSYKGENSMDDNPLKRIAEKFGMTEEEFLNGMKDMNLSITDQRTGKTWTMAPSEEELIKKIHTLSREGRIKAGKALAEIAEDPENLAI